MPDKNKTKSEAAEPTPEQVNVRIRYDSMDTAFASQFIVNASREEVILNLSPGYIAEPGTKDRLLPIQSRVALTPQGAARLVATLGKVLRETYGAKTAEEAAEAPGEDG